tara:strand:+ start:345 stop:500 length:156 start_codon:yes stop_codon:yes gene_type:complete
MTTKEFKIKNRKRILRQYRSNQGRTPKQYSTSAKVLCIAGFALLILILFTL